MNCLKTKRLILRHFTEKDINALFAILSDKDVNTFLPMYPLRNIEEAKKYFQYIKDYIQQKGHYYAICHQRRQYSYRLYSCKRRRQP